VAAADAVAAGERASYALCRPSGHHVRGDRASGFCYLNNAAIAVERLRTRFARVAVLDVDAHHGDGTQQIFYRRADVLTVSLHVDPANYYPFYTGYAAERGHGAGLGYNLNLPLAPGAGDADLLSRLDEGLAAIRDYRPDALVMSLGFDTHDQDPIGALHVSTGCFGDIGARVRALALPTTLIQEGGYAVQVIGACLTAFLREFLRA
jgi:acetoin utilization deacetylase AcuC-like enzyme